MTLRSAQPLLGAALPLPVALDASLAAGSQHGVWFRMTQRERQTDA